jgi:hypothetical protein
LSEEAIFVCSVFYLSLKIHLRSGRCFTAEKDFEGTSWNATQSIP